LFFDNKPVINFFVDSIDYFETHAINAQVDVKFQNNGGVPLQHLSQLPGDHSRIYNHTGGDGVLELNDTGIHTVRIDIKDAYQNTSTLTFQVQYDENAARSVSPHIEHQRFNPNFVSTWEENDFEVYLPENTLYDTLQPAFTRNNISAQPAISANFKFGDASIPAGNYFTVRIKPNTTIAGEWQDKMVIKNSYGARSTVKKAGWQNGWLTATFDDFGTYQAFTDLLPPQINFPGKADTADLSSSSRIVFWPTDNFGIASFRAELDGKWLRFTNDKGRAYIYNFDERCPYGVHELKVTVTDLVGNVTVKSGWFRKHEYTAPKKKAGKKKAAGVKKKAGIRKKKK
jgi:hypothetical protein